MKYTRPTAQAGVAKHLFKTLCTGKASGIHAAKRSFATEARIDPLQSSNASYRIVVIGGGTAGLSTSHQLLRTGQFAKDDIAIIDPSTTHDYQPGWTLVGGGLKNKEELRTRLDGLVDPKIKLHQEAVLSVNPEQNTVNLSSGRKVQYDQLVVAPGISINYDHIAGLPQALADPDSMVSTIYGYDTCDKVFKTISKLRKGTALFTQPAGPIKCAGAPQKAMWLAQHHWSKAGLCGPGSKSDIEVAYATGLPAMFGVPKYSERLEALRQERGVTGLFQHDLSAVDGNKAIFNLPDGKKAEKEFDLLHVVPKMGPHAFIAQGPLADKAGFVDVDQHSLQHTKYANVWSLGDASSLPTSKTAAAVTAQAPVLISNMLATMEGKTPQASYDGYTSCPLTTEYGKVMLAEFKYGGQPKETFGKWFGIDQGTPRKAFYHLKKDFFPWVYYKAMVKGQWAGPNGYIR
jgi:sulfide:quinone oxidoreductase